MKFRFIHSVNKLTAPIRHYDPTIFPDDSDWYKHFENFISAGGGSSRCIAYGRSEDAKDELLFPTSITRVSSLLTVMESLDNYYSVDYRPICSTVAARMHIEPLLQWLLNCKNPDLLLLRALDAESIEVGTIIHSLRKLGWYTYLSPQQINWTHQFNGNYEDYIASRSSRLRNTLKRKTAKLFAVPGIKVTVHDGTTDLEQAVEAYNHVYANSWKVPEPHPEFVPQLIRATADLGQLRLGIVWLNDMPVAVHFWIVKRQTAFIYKLAHDKAFDQYSPGTVLMGQMIRYTMKSDNVRNLDFLSGDDQYKRDWMSVRSEKIQIHAYNPGSLVAQFVRYRDQHFKPFVKRFTA